MGHLLWLVSSEGCLSGLSFFTADSGFSRLPSQRNSSHFQLLRATAQPLTLFALKGMDLATSCELSMLMRSFAKACSSQEIRPPEWNVTLALRSLTEVPYEPLLQVSLRHVTLKIVFLLVLASVNRVGELHGISHEV